MSDSRLPRGYVQVYTGDGKGKTTAALGLALRAAGHGIRTYIGQFMKGQHYGELDALRDHPHITIEQYGDPRCIRHEEVTPEHVAQARRGLERARQAMLSGEYAIVVLDEANVGRFRALLEEFSEQTQFIVITHNRQTIEAADTIYGISMGDEGVSQVVSLRLQGEEVSS